MDVVSSVGAVVGLVFNFARAIKSCNDLRGRYRDADRTIASVKDELETLHGALQELANLMMHDAAALSSRWDSSKTLPRTFERALRGFNRTIKSLDLDLEGLKNGDKEGGKVLGKRDKIKFLWNEDAMKDHLSQLRAQSSALQLLLMVLQTGSISEVKSNINNLEAAVQQLSISSSGDGDNEPLPVYSSHILDSQEDLLDLEWSESMEEAGTAPAEVSVHAEILRSALSPTVTDPTETDDTTEHMPRLLNAPESRSTSSSVSPPPIVETKLDSGIDSSPPSPSSWPVRRIESSEDVKPPPRMTDSISPIQLPKTHPIIEEMAGLKRSSSHRDLWPVVISAVAMGSIEEVSMALDDGHDIETRHPVNQSTGLIIAASLGYFPKLKLLLDRNADVAATDRLGRTALHFAASEDSQECVELLVSRGAPIACEDVARETPLHRAARYFRPDSVEILLKWIPDPLSHRNEYNQTALHLAARNDGIRIIDQICAKIRKIEHQSNCSASNENDSLSTGSCSCPVSYRGTEIEDDLGDTALQIAIYRGSIDTVSSLLKYTPNGVDAPQKIHHWRNKKLLTQDPTPWERPLHYAVRVSSTALVKRLLGAAADVTLRNSTGQTPLETAVHLKNTSAICTLLSHGAQVDIPCTEHKNTSLLSEIVETFTGSDFKALIPVARDISQVDSIARVLIRRSIMLCRWANVRSILTTAFPKDHVGRILVEENVLMDAIQFSSKEIVEFVLQSGANVHTIIELGDRWELAIHIAAKRNDVGIAEVLLEHGALLSSKDSLGSWPFHHAVERADGPTIRWYFEATKSSIKNSTTSETEAENQLRIVLLMGLIMACLVGSLEKVILLLDFDSTGQSAKDLLHQAVQYGRQDITAYLLEHGHDPQSLDEHGRLATDLPYIRLHADSVRLGNSFKDYETCKALVQEAISREKFKTRRRDSYRPSPVPKDRKHVRSSVRAMSGPGSPSTSYFVRPIN